MIRDSGWNGRVVTAYRPDAVVDPDFEGFSANLDQLGEITGCDTGNWAGYLDAHRRGAPSSRNSARPSSDHGHPTAETANLSERGGRGTVQPRPARHRRTSASSGCSAPRC